MGRETASALARWFVFEDHPVRAELRAVCDLDPRSREWFRRVPSVELFTADHRELLAFAGVDVVYVALPHHLHERVYLDVLEAGKDLLAEKPFGIDRAAAGNIARMAGASGRFVRCSSEFPFLPGARRVCQIATEGRFGKLLEVRSGFHHSSDLDPEKPANWKRREETCGKIGVMGDLGMHAVHIPFRLGWRPARVYAQLQRGYATRPDGGGGTSICDTWDNALLHTDLVTESGEIPARFEMKRMAPGETNTWFIEILGTDGGACFSTKTPKTLWTFRREGGDQQWQRTDLGFQSVFPTITGGIFESGFPDCFQQMWAAFLAERHGVLNGRFGCVTPEEAVLSHDLFEAALRSHDEKRAVEIPAA